jgi:alkylglycerol monooxygenase
MEQYGKILVIAIPLFLLFVVLEKLLSVYKKDNKVPVMDAVSSLSSGMTNAVKDVLGLSLTLITYEWMVSNLALINLEASLFIYLFAFIVIDFQGYWSHRWAHKINLFWNKHAIHHSSEEFNLACALRQSIASFINIFTFLLLPAAILGVPTSVISITLPIHLFLQFWYHTRHINKLGFLEKILVTPSHHRVHHAINPIYMDKNLSQIFIFWDKLFGTFQEELATEPPIFGITRPAQTWNPIRINFQHISLLIKDAWRANNWKERLIIWFKPTGWRPYGFEEKYPIKKIDNIQHFEKYGLYNSKTLITWSCIQSSITLLFVVYMFNNIASIGIQYIFFYGLFIFITIYSYTELMDKKRHSIFWEMLRITFGLVLVFYIGDWFGLNNKIASATYFVIAYFVISFFVNIYFVFVEFNNDKSIL